MTDAVPAPLAATSRARLATRAVFAMAGSVFAAWAPMVPLAKARLGLDEGDLGLLLLFLGLGSLLAMPVTGALTTRLGCRPIILAGGLVALAVLPALARIDDPLVFALALAVFGGAIATVDVAMNVQAVLVERAHGVPMMSGFHGLFSAGGMGGAAVTSGLLWAGLSPLAAALAVSLLALALLVIAAPGLLREGGDEGERAPLLVFPRGAVLAVGLLCLLGFLVEGAVLDWSAVYLVEVRDAAVGVAGLGYAAFALTMTAGRLGGDRLRAALGDGPVLLAGGIVAAGGFALTLLLPGIPMALLGFAAVGAGLANIVPVLFSAAARTDAMPPALAIAAVSILGYLGFIAGPALVGFVADATDLRFSLAMLAVMLLVLGWTGRGVVRG